MHNVHKSIWGQAVEASAQCKTSSIHRLGKPVHCFLTVIACGLFVYPSYAPHTYRLVLLPSYSPVNSSAFCLETGWPVLQSRPTCHRIRHTVIDTARESFIFHFFLYRASPRPMPDWIASASLTVRPRHVTLIGLMPRNPITYTASRTASFLDISIPFPLDVTMTYDPDSDLLRSLILLSPFPLTSLGCMTQTQTWTLSLPMTSSLTDPLR